MDFERQHSSPLESARFQISNTVSQAAVDAIGHLAAAMVVVATENGYLYDKDRSTAIPLREVCSHRFLNSYNNMLACFGWEGLLHSDRRDHMAGVLSDTVDNFNFRSGHNELNTLGSLISEACHHYANKYDEPMLLGKRSIETRGLGEDSVIEYAIYLAAEGLLFAFCAEIPKYQLFRPLEPFKLDENTKLLVELLQPPNKIGGQRPEGDLRGYSFWDLRNEPSRLYFPARQMFNPPIWPSRGTDMSYTPLLLQSGTKALQIGERLRLFV